MKYQVKSAEARPGQPLEEHCCSVSKLCGSFAAQFGSEECGRLLGVVHDWGKAVPAWQRYLYSNAERGSVTHAPESAGELFHALPGPQYAGVQRRQHDGRFSLRGDAEDGH